MVPLFFGLDTAPDDFDGSLFAQGCGEIARTEIPDVVKTTSSLSQVCDKMA